MAPPNSLPVPDEMADAGFNRTTLPLLKQLVEDLVNETFGGTDGGPNATVADWLDGGAGTETATQPRTMTDFHIIKAVVLSVVIMIIMFSVCKMVFDLFVRYAEKSYK